MNPFAGRKVSGSSNIVSFFAASWATWLTGRCAPAIGAAVDIMLKANNWRRCTHEVVCYVPMRGFVMIEIAI